MRTGRSIRAAALIVCVLAGPYGCASLPTATPRPIRVLVLNMHAGKDAHGASNLDGIAALVDERDPDIVLLQEVDRNTHRSGRVDQVAVLGERTRYATAFAPSLLAYDGGQYGIAMLAKGLIGYHATMPLRVRPEQTRAGGSHEPRVALVTIAAVNGTDWRVVNTHLDPAEGAARAQEIGALLGAVQNQIATGGPVLVGGDFNSTPDNPVLQPLRAAGLRDAWTECGSGDGFTYPADNPAKRIDYLWLTGNLHCASAEVLDTEASDHRPLLVTLK